MRITSFLFISVVYMRSVMAAYMTPLLLVPAIFKNSFFITNMASFLVISVVCMRSVLAANTTYFLLISVV